MPDATGSPEPAPDAFPAPDILLARDMAAFHDDPLGFVRYAFAWGSGDLEGFAGPDAWQAAFLADLGKGALTAKEAVRLAVASGHGVGKSALVAWIILWAMSTRPHLAGVITANTGTQLADKTWRELALWHKRAVNRHWFRWTATKFHQKNNPDTWFVSAIPWSKDRPEAFAGLHAENVLMLFDEASAIDEAIWETAEGAMTTKGAIWAVFGNPTRNSGAFHACFHRFRHRWLTRQVDSRDAAMANKAQIAQWVEDYGEDSDFVRIRVRGVFPRAGSNQLISSESAHAAAARSHKKEAVSHAARIIGVDVARFGDDQSALIRRQGLAAFGLRSWRGLDTMALAGLVAREIAEFRPDAVFVDAGGIGAGVVDRLRQLGHDSVIGVNFGAAAGNKNLYYNKRSEMWCLLRDWLASGGSIPDDKELLADLTAPEYGFTGDKSQIALEKKKDMKSRGLASPDKGDALALTFAYPVAPAGERRSRMCLTEYDVTEYGLHDSRRRENAPAHALFDEARPGRRT